MDFNAALNASRKDLEKNYNKSELAAMLAHALISKHYNTAAMPSSKVCQLFQTPIPRQTAAEFNEVVSAFKLFVNDPKTTEIFTRAGLEPLTSRKIQRVLIDVAIDAGSSIAAVEGCPEVTEYTDQLKNLFSKRLKAYMTPNKRKITGKRGFVFRNWLDITFGIFIMMTAMYYFYYAYISWSGADYDTYMGVATDEEKHALRLYTEAGTFEKGMNWIAGKLSVTNEEEYNQLVGELVTRHREKLAALSARLVLYPTIALYGAAHTTFANYSDLFIRFLQNHQRLRDVYSIGASGLGASMWWFIGSSGYSYIQKLGLTGVYHLADALGYMKDIPVESLTETGENIMEHFLFILIAIGYTGLIWWLSSPGNTALERVNELKEEGVELREQLAIANDQVGKLQFATQFLLERDPKLKAEFQEHLAEHVSTQGALEYQDTM